MALVLGRACGEKVFISTGAGEIITLWVANIGRTEVRLAFEAPRTVSIVREETTRKESNGNQPIRRGVAGDDLG